MLIQEDQHSWIWLVISILAVWRLTTLLCYEAGPFNFMTSLRKVLYKNKLGKLIDCFHCTALWVSIGITCIVYIPDLKSILLILAIAGGASLIEKILNHESFSQESNESSL